MIAIAVEDCASGQHLGIEHRMLTDQAQEIATVAIGPVEHRGNAEFSIDWHTV